MEDLDPEAIAKAREQFRVKHPRQADEVPGWEDATFLNKAKLTIKGAVTNAAVLLVGRPESATLLSPVVAKISWILKDGQNRELDYEHFGPPFLLQVDRVLQRIRNLTLRTLPSGTLFPQEVTQYDPWVIREALHNCIAHQDYSLRGRINVVETPTLVLLSNVGSFLPGDVETVIRQDAPLEIYRNPFLAEAMVNLNMIDTQGGGIKRMFQAQIKRFFPLPDYDLSEPERVAVTVRGSILDEQYCQLLMERGDLDLWLVILLDKVQKRVPISKEDHRRLKRAGLVEGRYPNLIISGRVARLTGQKARHIREKGFDNRYYLDLLVALIRSHGPVSRSEVDRLLLDKLPEVLTDKQKRIKVHNLLSALSRGGQIQNAGTRGQPRGGGSSPSRPKATEGLVPRAPRTAQERRKRGFCLIRSSCARQQATLEAPSRSRFRRWTVWRKRIQRRSFIRFCAQQVARAVAEQGLLIPAKPCTGLPTSLRISPRCATFRPFVPENEDLCRVLRERQWLRK